jgi:hypothetical protein
MIDITNILLQYLQMKNNIGIISELVLILRNSIFQFDGNNYIDSELSKKYIELHIEQSKQKWMENRKKEYIDQNSPNWIKQINKAIEKQRYGVVYDIEQNYLQYLHNICLNTLIKIHQKYGIVFDDDTVRFINFVKEKNLIYDSFLITEMVKINP